MTIANQAAGQRNPYLLNSWYCAGWAHDLDDAPIARTFLDKPVVLYRTESGRAVALKDECPHRFAPLSMGRREGENLVCPYHGLRFDPEGVCVDARFPERGRSGPCVQSYPIVERQSILWIWMGDPAVAETTPTPDLPFFDRPERPKMFGTTHVKANFELENDNLLDLSHLDYVHRGTIAQDLSLHGVYSAEQNGNRVSSIWYGEDVPMADHFVPVFGGERSNVDTWMKMHWSPPSILMLDTGIKRTGADNSEAFGTLQGHFITPETQSTSHYFWGVTLHPAFAPAAEEIRLATTRAFEEEDRPLIEAVQRRLGTDDFWARRPVILKDDGGAVRARRLLDQLIKAEMRASDFAAVAAE